MELRPRTYVLLCEDDENDAFLFEREWQKAGCKIPIRTMANGMEVLELLRKCMEKLETAPELIISDHRLLLGGGMDILKFVRNEPWLQHVPVVLTSGIINPAEQARAMGMGAVDYLEKPITHKAVMALIQKIGLPHC